MNTYSWNCSTVDVYPTYEDLDDVVYTVHWRLTATSDQDDPQGNPYTATVYGTESVSLADIGTDFIPFADLTNEITTGWAETAMGEDKVQEQKDIVDANIDEQITPTSETKTIGE
jgi:hypothetical protein